MLIQSQTQMHFVFTLRPKDLVTFSAHSHTHRAGNSYL